MKQLLEVEQGSNHQGMRLLYRPIIRFEYDDNNKKMPGGNLKINIKKALTISLICNLASFLFGLLFIGAQPNFLVVSRILTHIQNLFYYYSTGFRMPPSAGDSHNGLYSTPTVLSGSTFHCKMCIISTIVTAPSSVVSAHCS